MANLNIIPGRKIAGATYDILRGINATVWGGTEEAAKVGRIVKGGLSGTDIVLGANFAVEDFQCNDMFCGTLDVVGCLSTTVGINCGLWRISKDQKS